MAWRFPPLAVGRRSIVAAPESAFLAHENPHRRTAAIVAVSLAQHRRKAL
jgi:hypothetical protein